MELVAKMDGYGKTAWIVAMVLGFIIFWPIGLAILAFLLWSGRMGCWRNGGPGRWHRNGTDDTKSGPESWFGGRRRETSSGNWAFDEYRQETLRRLEEEQQEFRDFLERLRPCQGQVGVRPVHGRPPTSPSGRRGAASRPGGPERADASAPGLIIQVVKPAPRPRRRFSYALELYERPASSRAMFRRALEMVTVEPT